MAANTPPAQGRSDAVGIALIIGAVLIGLLLLVKGYDAEGGAVAKDAKSSSQSTTTTVPVEETTTTTVVTNAPAQVQVKVANASGTSGVATKTKNTLAGKGYTQVTVADAPSVVTATQVLYVPGAQGDAQAVAAALGLPATAVQPMPTPTPVTLGEATVLVLAGPDLA
jgi:LytR cell envelope-related transcriptional attenuator